MTRPDATDPQCVKEGVLCTSCAYDLRLLPLDGVCPECGTPVSHSFHFDMLQFANPKWVTRLSSGAGWLINWVQSLILIGFLSFLQIDIAQGIPVLLVLGALSAVFGCLGIWMFSAPDPGAGESRTSIAARPLARYAMTTACLCMAAATFVRQLVGFTRWEAAVLLAADLALAIGIGPFCRVGRDVARRIPRMPLAKSLETFATIVLAAAALSAFVEAVVLLTDSPVWVPSPNCYEASRILLYVFVAMWAMSHATAMRKRLRPVAESK